MAERTEERRYRRPPTNTSRICSCHFPEGKERGPVLFIDRDGDICPDHKVPRPVQQRAPAQVSGSHPKSTNLGQPHEQPTISANQSQATMTTTEDGLHSQSFTDSDDSPAESVILDHNYESSEVNTELVIFPAHLVPPPDRTPLRSPHVATQTDLPNLERLENILLQVQLRELREETKALTQKLSSFQTRYTPSRLSDEVVKMETGLPDRECFNKIVEGATALESSVSFNYRYGWKVKSLSVEEQVFLTLMKMRHDYKDFHLGALFSIGEGTIYNVTQTWIEVLKGLLDDDSIPSPRDVKAQKRKRNAKAVSPSSGQLSETSTAVSGMSLVSQTPTDVSEMTLISQTPTVVSTDISEMSLISQTPTDVSTDVSEITLISQTPTDVSEMSLISDVFYSLQ